MAANAEQFLDIYNTIDQFLRRRTNVDRSIPFYKLVDVAGRTDRVVAQFEIKLKEFADLRNAIVHERIDGRIIAEPDDQAVKDFSKIASLLTDPPKAIPLF